MEITREDLSVITEEPTTVHEGLADVAGLLVGTAVAVGVVVHHAHTGAWTLRRRTRRLRLRPV